MRRLGSGTNRRLRAALAILACSPLLAQEGVHVLTFHSDVDDSEQPYAVYVPASPASGRKFPLLISLHSEDSNHRLNLRQMMAPEVLPATRRAEFVIASPLARGTMGYEGIAEKDVYDVLADVERRFPIDEDRVYLTGVSMGGAGALRLALTRPDVWAAVAAVCPAPEAGFEGLAGNALDLPIRIFQGDQDPIVPVENARLWQRRMMDAGVAAEYLEFPGVRHNAWVLAYRNGALLEWLGRFRRQRFPDRVRFTTTSYRYGSAYWVRIDGLEPGTTATVDARRAGAEVSVQTGGVEGLTLVLDRPVSQVVLDGQAVRVRPLTPLSFQKSGGRWRAGLFQPAGKRPGAEGPITEAAGGRQIYVYGTGGEAGADEIAARRKIAQDAAGWSAPPDIEGMRLNLAWAVKADTDLTAADLASADLILFGTRRTNSAIARLAAQLPLALDPGAADYGLLFVAPAGGHYALVSSGLPWWTGAEEAHRSGWPFAPAQLRLLSTFGDYILFKGSLANVVAEGRFDADWKLPAEARRKLAASGTVSIRP
jgi:pimeloyl-ACP methyl ester carboxylesterase